MKNRILHLTRTIIPYVKELMPLAHSVTGCLLMQQLDYWFERQPDGFFKFLEPADEHSAYRPGDSWCEELGISRAQFRTAFEAIGTIYKSKSEFDKADDKFQGRFYCSFYDRRRQLTFYYRNHELVDKALDALISVKPTSSGNFGSFSGGNGRENTVNDVPAIPVIEQPSVTVKPEPVSTVIHNQAITGIQDSVTHESSYPELQEGQLSPLLDTETTGQTIQRLQPQLQCLDLQTLGETALKPGSSSDLVFPQFITDAETVTLTNLLATYPVEVQQQILDEVEGARQKNTLRSGAVPFARFLASAFDVGQFVQNLGVAVCGARQKRIAQRLIPNQATLQLGADDVAKSIATLPPSMQNSLQSLRAKAVRAK